jgi:two-component system cell cycle sensor histidine kinase/response regulator CckA
MPKGGKLTIETANAVLDESQVAHHVDVTPGPYVMLAVSDNGYGMTPETKARIFEPFFTTKPPGQGTGMGLATVYGIVKQSGGHVWVCSEPAQGTSLKIYLPQTTLREKDPEMLSSVAQTSRATGSETILLVEDEQSVRDLARSVLEKRLYRFRCLRRRGGTTPLERSLWRHPTHDHWCHHARHARPRAGRGHAETATQDQSPFHIRLH